MEQSKKEYTYNHNENINKNINVDNKQTYRKVDDARIHEADVQQVIRLKELDIEMIKLQNETRQKHFLFRMKTFIVIGYSFLLAAVIFLPAVFPMSMAGQDIQSLSVLLIPIGGIVAYFALRRK